MAFHRTPEQVLQHYVDKMGSELGHVFHRLFNDNAWLHMKWNEFVKLFATSPEQIETLNAAAPGFFFQVSELWWHDLLLHISRMTDNESDVLSVYSLSRHAPPGIRPEIKIRLEVVERAVAFARDARHRTIAHRNIDLALQRATINFSKPRESQRRPCRIGRRRRFAALRRTPLLRSAANDVAIPSRLSVAWTPWSMSLSVV